MAAAAVAPQVNGLLRFIFGGGGQAPFGRTWTREHEVSPSASSTGSCVRRRLPKVSGPVPEGPGSSLRCALWARLRASHLGETWELAIQFFCVRHRHVDPRPCPCFLVDRVVRILAPSGNSMAQDLGPLRHRGYVSMSLSSIAVPLAFLSLSENRAFIRRLAKTSAHRSH